ncbi:MAG: hypothetical protein ACTSPI_14260 [Candidatus Heimdallarchaeaceae archaeon]
MQAMSIKFNKSYKLTFENLQEYLKNHNIYDIRIIDNITDVDVEFELEQAEENQVSNSSKNESKKLKAKNNLLLLKNDRLQENIEALKFSLKKEKKLNLTDLEKRIKSLESKLSSTRQTSKETKKNNTRYRAEIVALEKQNEKLVFILSGIKKAASSNASNQYKNAY